MNTLQTSGRTWLTDCIQDKGVMQVHLIFFPNYSFKALIAVSGY